MFLDSFQTVFDIIAGDQSGLWQIVGTSLKVSLLATLIASVFGILTGFAVALNDFRGKRLVLILFNTMLAVPTVVVGLFLYGFLSRRGYFGDFGMLYTYKAMVIGQAVLIFPIVATFVHSAIRSLDPNLEKTARALGAKRVHRMILVASEARFSLMLAIIAAFGRAISEVGISMMLGGNISGFTRNMTTTIALEHNKGNFALAMAVGLILLSITFGVNLAMYYIQRGRVR